MSAGDFPMTRTDNCAVVACLAVGHLLGELFGGVVVVGGVDLGGGPQHVRVAAAAYFQARDGAVAFVFCFSERVVDHLPKRAPGLLGIPLKVGGG